MDTHKTGHNVQTTTTNFTIKKPINVKIVNSHARKDTRKLNDSVGNEKQTFPSTLNPHSSD